MAKLGDFTKTAGMNGGAEVYAKMMRTTDIQVDPELAAIFPISDDMLTNIVDSMKERGYDKAEPIVIWKGKNIVVDGRTRLSAALEAEILEVPVEEKEFETMEDAKVYTYLRQAMRRNLTQAEIFNAATSLNLEDKRDGTGRAANKLAKLLGVSPSTIYHARAVKENAPEELVEKIKNGGININKVYQQMKGKKPQIDKPVLPEREVEDDSPMEPTQEPEFEPVIPDVTENSDTVGDLNLMEETSAVVEVEPLPIVSAISAIENFLNTHRSDDLEDIGELEKALEILEGIKAA